jgi:DNA-binding MarR family transcriptional regulator
MPDPKGAARRMTPAAPLAPALDPRAPEPRGGADAKSAPQQAGSNLLFLREEEIRAAQDLLFFAYRDFTNAADVILDELGLGRAHHRALHFIGRNPGLPVSELLAILRITTQSLARVLTELVDQGFVAQAQGRADRRQRLLTLTAEGQALERRLFERQRERLVAAYREAGAGAVEGFRRVMRGIMDEQARAYTDRGEAAAREPRPRQM